MLNSSLHGFHVHTIENGVTLTNAINALIKWVNKTHLTAIKAIVYTLIIALAFVLSPLLYIYSIYIFKDVRNKINSVKKDIPLMSLDDLNELVRLTNKIKGKVPFDQLKNSLTSGPFITAPYNSALYQIICAIDEVETMATKQIESDLQAFSNGWENEMPLGVIPHEVGNSNW